MSKRRIGLVVSLCCLLILSVPLTSPNASADNMTLYTDYYQYDNNETLEFHIVGTNNTTYTLMLFHRDSDAPLVIAHARIGENNTTTTGYIALYEFEDFGVMELRAENTSYNQSAKCEFRLVASQAWWEDEVDDMVGSFWLTVWQMLGIISALYAIPIFIGIALLIRYRDKVKAASGELTISERMKLEDIWNYDDYANDVCARNPHSPSERARLKYSTAMSLMFKVMRAKKKMGLYRQLEEKEKELSSRLPGLVNDVFDALVNEGIVTEKQLKDMDGDERYKLLHPGQKRERL